ncbi:MAG: excalibur calcium-binding domain-containing protein [Sphingopyxis sp.]|nr:excalibur calcium-binding domain-containing protein [Sphingopyxis sp.]
MLAARFFCLAIAITGSASPALSHGGGLNAQGCHNDRKNGGYHCHRSPSGDTAQVRPQPMLGSSGGAAFPNCTAARSAGAAPVRVGDPGYGRHLDRDGDGVGCE